MDAPIPSADKVREMLKTLKLDGLERLGALSGVPVSTLYRIRSGTTPNPGIETVRKFMLHISKAAEDKAA